MIYRPEQKEGKGKSESCEAFYTRKQSVKHNRVAGEAEVLHDKDRNAESDQYKWEGAPAKDRWGKSSSLWDDD